MFSNVINCVMKFYFAVITYSIVDKLFAGVIWFVVIGALFSDRDLYFNKVLSSSLCKEICVGKTSNLLFWYCLRVLLAYVVGSVV